MIVTQSYSFDNPFHINYDSAIVKFVHSTIKLKQYYYIIMAQDPLQQNQSFYPQETNPYLQPNTQPASPSIDYDQPQFDSYPQSSDYANTSTDAQYPPVQYPNSTTDFAPDFNNPNLMTSSSISPENMLPQQGLAAEEIPNTFETKTNNKLVMVLGIILVVGLLIATGILVYLNFFRNQPTTPQNNTSQVSQNQPTNNNTDNKTTEEPKAVDVKMTGGENTPATLSRKNNASTASKDWLKISFVSPDVDKDGNCTVQTKCGDTADYDNDGLTTVEEYNFGTDPLVSDTDTDGISDGNEVFVYYTNPTKADSDADTFKDGAELTNCYDPSTTPAVSKDKMTVARLAQISDSVALKPLKDDTIKTLKSSGATSSDLAKGYISAKCTPPAPTPTTTATGTTTTSK